MSQGRVTVPLSPQGEGLGVRYANVARCMAKRKKGRLRRRKSEPITRRDLEAKRARRESQKRDDDEPDESDEADEDEPEEDDDDDDAIGDDESDAPPPSPPSERSEGAAWAEPLLRLEQKWTWLEVRVSRCQGATTEIRPHFS